MGTEAAKKVGTLLFVIITIIIAIITVVGATVPNPQESTFAVYIAMGMPAVLMLNVILVIYWIFRLKIWFIVHILAILANWNYLTAVIQFNSPDKAGHNLKVATYNVGSFNHEITGYTAKEISRYMHSDEGVDIICMQEYTANKEFNLDSLSSAFKYYKYQAIPVDEEGRTRVVVFSKFPILKSARIAFENTQNCAMYSDIAVNGEVIRVFNLHLQTTNLHGDLSKSARRNLDAESTISMIENSLLLNSQKRAKQAQSIQNMIKKSPHPVILCGDFNVLPSTYEYNLIADVLKDGFKECGSGYNYTFNGLLKALRIDYIFSSDSIEGVNYYSTPQKWSDHNPVIMELNFGKS